MTAPSLLDELEGVRARFDEWWFASKYMQVVYSPESTRQAALDGYIAAHADMAKRLEAAERGAARYRWLRDESLGQWEHPICVSQERSPLGMRYVGPLIGDSLDAAIDAAAQEGEG